MVRGKERVRALSEKLALQDLGLVAGSTKRAKRHVSPAAKLEESQHKLLCFLQMNPQWLKRHGPLLRVALTEQSWGWQGNFKIPQ